MSSPDSCKGWQRFIYSFLSHPACILAPNHYFCVKEIIMSIQIDQVTKRFGQQKALDRVSFSVDSGEVVGFLGPNGAGKSTLMRIITGFLTPDEGRVTVNGLPVSGEALKVKRLIGYLPESNPLYTDMYVMEYLRYTAGIYKIRDPHRVEEMIEATGLQPECHKKIGNLSRGFRQRVGLARALLHDPPVLILDEPTTGLDPNQILEIRELISRTGKKKTVMLSTHIMQEVEAICQRVIIIDKGQIITDRPRQELSNAFRETKQVVLMETDREINTASLEKQPEILSVANTGKHYYEVRSAGRDDIRPLIFRHAVEKGYTILSTREKESNMEDIFRQLTAKNQK